MMSINVVLRDNLPSTGSLNGNLDQLKGIRTLGF
jgi:hypothetical protein